MAIKASESLYHFIKKSEGFRAKPYQDAGGKTAVGYGTTDGGAKKPVSEPEANAIMRQRVELAESELSSKITRSDLSSGQMDALVDMHYNLGGDTMSANGFIDMVNSSRDSEVSQQILRYTKAKNSKTGQMEELPGLVTRTKQRAEWWNGAPAPTQATVVGLDDGDLVNQMNEFDKQQGIGLSEDVQSAEDSDKILVRQMEQFDAVGVINPEDIGYRIQQMNGARGVLTTEEANRTQQVKDLSRELNIDPLTIDADLEVYSPEEIRTRASIPDTAKNTPALSKWASKPENYVLMENTGNWTTSLTRSVGKLNPVVKSDFDKTLENSLLEYPKAAVYTALLFGSLDPSKAQVAIDGIAKKQSELQVSQEAQDQLERLQSITFAPSIRKAIEGASSVYEIATNEDTNKLILPELEKVYDGSIETFGGILEYLKAMYENPEGAALTTTQAAVSSGLPVGLGILGRTRSPLLGFAGAFSASAMLSVAESIQKDLEEFRDEEGNINLQAAFSDPARVARWRKRAAAYGVVMGASDAIYSKFIGKGFTKVLKKGGKAAVPKALAKEFAAGAIEEGASQGTATIARDVVVGEVDKETFVRAGEEAITEAIYGGIIGGSMGSVTSVLSTGKQKFNKMKHKIEQADAANEGMVQLHEAKTVLKQDDASKNNKDQISDLIDEATQIPVAKDDTSIYENVDEVTDSEASTQETTAVNGSIQIAPSEIIAFFEDQGLVADDELRVLPPEVYAEFVKNKDSDTMVNMAVSDWMQVLEDFPEVDEIVRVNGGDLNVREASESTESIQKNPFSLFQEIPAELQVPDLPGEVDEADLPPVPQTQQEIDKEQSIIETPFEPSEVINLNEIKSRFRSEEDAKAYNLLSHRLRTGTKGIKGIAPEAVKAFADVQFQQMRNRANNTGRELSELVKTQKIQKGKSNKVYGSYTHLFNKIFFSQHANPSTIVHEFGHQWLHEMTDDYVFMAAKNLDDMTPDQRNYWYSMEAAARLLKVDNVGLIQGMNAEEATRIHETFAETSEEYFLEGNFGNSIVKAAMEQFRKWMVTIVDLIRRTAAPQGHGPLDITPEVERMFEGIIGVDNNIDEDMMPLFADPLFDPATLGEKAQEYYNTTRDALSESVGLFASRIMNASYKEREALITSAANAAFDKASSIVNSLPEMILGAQMQDSYNEYRAALKAGKTVSDPRISYKSFAQLFAGDQAALDIARAKIPNYLIAGKKKGGVDINLLMYNIDVGSTEQMVSILTTIGDKENMIAQKADDILEETYPILKSDQAIRDAAVVSLGNGKTTKFLQMEMKILATDYLPTLKNLAELFITSPETMMKEDSIEARSTEIVSESRLYKFSANSFRVDYGRLARKSARFFKQGDFANAFDSKVRSAISYRAHIKAVAAQKKIAGTTKRAKQFLKYSKGRDFKNSFNPELMLFGTAFMNAVNTGDNNLPTLDVDSFPDGSGVSQNMVDGINKFISDFKSRTRGTYGIYMTVGNYVEFGEAIKFIQTQARNAKKIELGNKNVRLEDVQEQTALEFNQSKSRAITYERQGYSQVKVEKDQVYTVLGSLYENDAAFSVSAVGNLASDLEDGQAFRSIETRKDIHTVTEAFKKIALTSKNTKLESVLGPVVNRVPFSGSVWNYDANAKPIISRVDNFDIKFNNLSEYIMAELIMGSPSGAEKLLRGGTELSNPDLATYDGENIDTTKWVELRNQLITDGILKKEHFEAMQTIWDMLREKQPAVKKALRKTDGFLIGNISGWDVVTPFGTFKGGYIPISPSKQQTDAAKFASLIDPDANGFSPTQMYPRQNTGMSNQRNQAFFPMSLDANKLVSYISSANDIIYMREPLVNFGKVFMDPKVRMALENKRPGAMENMIEPWYVRVTNQQRTEPATDGLNKLAVFLRKNVNRSIYLFKVLTPLKQPFGLIPALTAVKPKHLVRATLDVATRPFESIEEVRESSVVMQDRFDATVRRHIADWEQLQTRFDWVAQADEVIDKVTFIAIQAMQNRVDVSIWLGAKAQAEAAGNMTPSEITHFADSAVQSTQSASSVTYLNNIQTGQTISKMIQGIATSYLFAVNNVVTKEAMRNPDKVAQAKSLIGLGLLVYFIPSLLDQGLEVAYKSLTSDEEDDEEVRVANIVQRAALGSLSPVLPIVGNVASSVMYSGSTDFAPVFTKLARTGTGTVKGLTKNAQGINMTPGEMKSLLHTITLWTGIPTSVLAKDIFVEDVWIEGLNGETLDVRLRKRKWQLKRQKFTEGRK